MKDLRLMAEEAGHDDLGYVERVRAPAGHTHHSEEQNFWRAKGGRVYRQRKRFASEEEGVADGVREAEREQRENRDD